MPAPAAPPLAAPPGVTIVPPATPPKPPPAPTREIHLSAPTDPGPSPSPPKPGSARERLSQSLRAKAGITEPAAPMPPPSPVAPARTPMPEPPGTATPPEAPATGEPTDATPPAAPATPPATPEAAKGKTNPWKIVDQYKTRTAELEKKLAEASTLPEAKQKEYLTQIEQLQKRNEHLENEIRFVNYSESKEFKAKFQEPYEAAWQRALSELNEIDITDPSTGATRKAGMQDLADLLSVPLTKARELADQYFGAFADDIMAYRKEIKGLFETRAAALKEAKEQGSQRDKQRQEMMTKQQKDLSDFVNQTWEKTNAEMATHEKYGRFFTPTEGDQDGNQRLAKGFELVDRAFSEFAIVRDPSLTAEQRASIIKRHAAVRNRAAAFGRLVATNEKLAAEKAALLKELEQFKSSTPPSGGSGTLPSTTPAAPGNAHEAVFGKLRSLAR